jgi:hypothetical protein
MDRDIHTLPLAVAPWLQYRVRESVWSLGLGGKQRLVVCWTRAIWAACFHLSSSVAFIILVVPCEL